MPANARKAWDQFLDPAVMRPRLISASVYIAAFGSLKAAIVDRVRDFYWCGFDGNGDKIDPKYQATVLSRNRSPVYASLDWLRENGAIDLVDIATFDRVKKCRNQLSHRLFDLLGTEGLPADFNQCFSEMVALLRKIEVWWIVNVEIATDPDFDGKDVDEAGIVPGRIMTLKLLLDIALGPEQESRRYLEELRQHASGQNTI
jgi:hypothetical protein